MLVTDKKKKKTQHKTEKLLDPSTVLPILNRHLFPFFLNVVSKTSPLDLTQKLVISWTDAEGAETIAEGTLKWGGGLAAEETPKKGQHGQCCLTTYEHRNTKSMHAIDINHSQQTPCTLTDCFPQVLSLPWITAVPASGTSSCWLCTSKCKKVLKI